METPDEVTGPVNLGNTQEFRVLALAEHVQRLTGSRAGMEFCPMPHDDPMRRQPDARLALKILDWQATTPLEAGLAKTIDYFRSIETKA